MRNPGGEFIGVVFIMLIGASECDVCADVMAGGVRGVGYGVKNGVRGVINEGLGSEQGSIGLVVRDIKTVDARGTYTIQAQSYLGVSVL